MDFLLLLPHGRRVVLEVDGAHHHRTAAAYADTVRGDRELKLTGADVYRFGAAELSDLPRARPVMEIFFTDLFDAYEIPVPQDPR
jgi:very-short-patch-repair endonuclease